MKSLLCQIKELGLKTPLTSVETFEWSSNPSLFEGQWFVSDSIVPDFSAKFKATYGTDPMSGSSYVYDLVSLLIKTQESKDFVINHTKIYLQYSVAWGLELSIFGKIKIDKDGFFLTTPSVKIIKDGKAVADKEI